MAWVRVDDGFPNHPKLLLAADELPRNGLGRVMGLWLEALCYSNQHLTNGFISDSVAKRLRADSSPLDVFQAMEKAGMVRRVEGGWEIHDYLEYQFSREQVAEKRLRDRLRKPGKSSPSGGNPNAGGTVSAQFPPGTAPDSDRNGQENSVESGAPGPSQPVPTNPRDPDQDQRAKPAAREPDRNPRVLVRLAHDVLGLWEQGQINQLDIKEAFKDRIAKLRVSYGGDQVNKALDLAEVQRGRKW